MKILSIQQPWGTLIALGEKKIETRSWKTNYRGPLLIHAGKKVDEDICYRNLLEQILTKHGVIYTYGPRFYHCMPTGMIIAKCELIDCKRIIGAVYDDERNPFLQTGAILDNGSTIVDEDTGIEKVNEIIVKGSEYAFGDYTQFRYAWILDNIQMLDNPIPTKGKLGLWDFNLEG